MSTPYEIRARIVVDAPKLDQVNAKMNDLKNNAAKTGGSVNTSMLSGFASMLAGGVVIAALTKALGIVKELATATAAFIIQTGADNEKLKTGLINALADGYGIGLDKAADLQEKMERDAAERAKKYGVSGDIIAEVQAGATGALAKAGASPDQVGRITSLASAAGTLKGMNPGDISGEITKALMTQVSATRTPLVAHAMSAGDIKAINATEAGSSARLAALDKAMASFEDQIALAQDTWVGQIMRLKGNTDSLAETLTTPAFNEFITTVTDLNALLGSGPLATFASVVGQGLADFMKPLNDMINTMLETPFVISMINTFGTTLGTMLKDLGPIVANLALKIGGGLIFALEGAMVVIDIWAKATNAMAVTTQYLVDVFSEAAMKIANPISYETHFSAITAKYTEDLAKVFALEGMKRDKAVKEASDPSSGNGRPPKPPVKIEVKLDTKVEWGDTRSLSNAFEKTLADAARISYEAGTLNPR